MISGRCFLFRCLVQQHRKSHLRFIGLRFLQPVKVLLMRILQHFSVSSVPVLVQRFQEQVFSGSKFGMDADQRRYTGIGTGTRHPLVFRHQVGKDRVRQQGAFPDTHPVEMVSRHFVDQVGHHMNLRFNDGRRFLAALCKGFLRVIQKIPDQFLENCQFFFTGIGKAGVIVGQFCRDLRCILPSVAVLFQGFLWKG